MTDVESHRSGRLLVLPQWVDDFDEHVDELWEMLRGIPTLDRMFYWASAAGDFSAIWHVYNLARLATTRNGGDRFLRLASALAIESLLVNQGIKRAFRRQRPVLAPERPHQLRMPSTSSFPSGHASSATMAAMLLNERLLNERSRLSPITTGVAAVVATSRIHVRMHHASDVVAGVVVGAAVAAVWKRVWPLR